MAPHCVDGCLWYPVAEERFKASLSLDDLRDADLVVEAVFEEMGLKKGGRRLDHPS